MFVNAIEKTGARDVLERFSVAVEHLTPIVLAVVMVPSALALAGLGAYAGYEIGAGRGSGTAVQLVRYLLLATTVFAVAGPMILPAADRTNAVRLLLLPIPYRTLYVAQAAGALGDPWLLLSVPLVLAVPLGALAAAAPAHALAALVAGVLLLIVLVGVSSLTTSLIHVLLRDRRRGELLALAFVFILPFVSILPALIGSAEGRSRGDRERAIAADERPPRRKDPLPQWALDAGVIVFRMMPSELYASAVGGAARSTVGVRARGAAGLALAAAGLHAIGLLLFGRMLASPATTGGRRTATAMAIWERVVPGLSAPASAVALAQVRLALRTPRGRATLLTPLLVLVIASLMLYQAEDATIGPIRLSGGLAVATFAAAMSLLSSLPILMNQFAVDGAGLTLALLSPLSTRQLLAGKAVGNALIAIPPTLLAVSLAAMAFRSGSVWLWLSLVLAVIATYTLSAPASAVFSAVLPRQVDMNSIGSASNAHGLSGLLGLVAVGVAAAPAAALVAAAVWLLRTPALAPLFLLGWCGLAYLISVPLFTLAGRVFESRRENLAMLM
jgi:hypothetical protein